MRASQWGEWRMVAFGAAVVAGVVACGEPTGPRSQARDLEFIVPIAAPAGELQQELIASPYSTVGSMPAAVDETGAVQPSISDVFLKGYFGEFDFFFEYGFSGVGTSYTISPHVFITGADGRTLHDRPGLGLSENFFVPFMMFPTARERVPMTVKCGATGTVTAKFELSVSIEILGVIRFWSVQRNADDTAFQPACLSPSPSPQGGGPQDYEGNWLCFYDVWFDDYGRVVDWIEVGCFKIDGYAY